MSKYLVIRTLWRNHNWNCSFLDFTIMMELNWKDLKGLSLSAIVDKLKTTEYWEGIDQIELVRMINTFYVSKNTKQLVQKHWDKVKDVSYLDAIRFLREFHNFEEKR